MTETNKDITEETQEKSIDQESQVEQTPDDTQEEVTPQLHTDNDDAAQETEEEKNAREKAEYLDGWQRAQAEMVNLKKRHEEDRKMFTALGKESLLQELIPVLDNFDAAMGNKDVWESVDANWRTGIEYIHSQFIQALENNGVAAFGSEGDVFDANLHEPMESEGESETITVVMQKGYKMGERIIRPAKVKLG